MDGEQRSRRHGIPLDRRLYCKQYIKRILFSSVLLCRENKRPAATAVRLHRLYIRHPRTIESMYSNTHIRPLPYPGKLNFAHKLRHFIDPANIRRSVHIYIYRYILSGRRMQILHSAPSASSAKISPDEEATWRVKATKYWLEDWSWD